MEGPYKVPHSIRYYKSLTFTQFPHSNHIVTCGRPITKFPHSIYRAMDGPLQSYWHLLIKYGGSHIQILYGKWGTITSHPTVHTGSHIQIILEGPYHKSYWQLQGSHIPYKVWGNIRVIESDKVPHSIYGMGTIQVIDSYKVPTIKVWDHKSVTRFPHSIYGGP